MKIKTLLENEIQNEIEELGKCPIGTDEYKTRVDGVTKLTDRLIEFEKVNNDKYDREDTRYNEFQLKTAELEMERKDRKVKNWLTGVSMGTGFVVTCLGTWATFKFEETGTVTSLLGRTFIGRLVSKKQ